VNKDFIAEGSQHCDIVVCHTVGRRCDKATTRLVCDESSLRNSVPRSALLAGKRREPFATGGTEEADDILGAQAKMIVTAVAIGARLQCGRHFVIHASEAVKRGIE
jgi:hypothetical protein